MEEKYLTLKEAIIDGDVEVGAEQTKQLLESGLVPEELFSNCVEPTLNNLGDQFSRLEVFLPDLMVAGEVVEAIQEVALPFLKEGASEVANKGTAVICTAYGDLHDIGKNMVNLMMQVNGFKMIDLGVDVSPKDVVAKAAEAGADLVCLSGLMMPSLPYIEETIGMIRSDSMTSNVKVMVGGGPVTVEWANKAGADGYADDAAGAVAKAMELLA
jgi:methanogenic corrinoid protein MtbC1